MNPAQLNWDPEDDLDDFVDLRHPDLAEVLGVCPDLLREALRQSPTLGPIVCRQQPLDLIALIELEHVRQEEQHER
jgi:hypothetical protein